MDDLIERLEADLSQLKKAEAHANFGGNGLSVRVKDPSALIADLSDAIAALKARGEG